MYRPPDIATIGTGGNFKPHPRQAPARTLGPSFWLRGLPLSILDHSLVNGNAPVGGMITEIKAQFEAAGNDARRGHVFDAVAGSARMGRRAKSLKIGGVRSLDRTSLRTIIPCLKGINRDFSTDSAFPLIFDRDYPCEFSCLHENSLGKEQGICSNEQGILAGEQGFPFRYAKTASPGDRPCACLLPPLESQSPPTDLGYSVKALSQRQRRKRSSCAPEPAPGMRCGERRRSR
jgi:hypothetical protein